MIGGDRRIQVVGRWLGGGWAVVGLDIFGMYHIIN